MQHAAIPIIHFAFLFLFSDEWFISFILYNTVYLMYYTISQEIIM